MIHGVPVFYSLGRSVSADAADKLHNYVIDVHYADGLSKLVVHVGEMEGGFLRFREPGGQRCGRTCREVCSIAGSGAS